MKPLISLFLALTATTFNPALANTPISPQKTEFLSLSQTKGRVKARRKGNLKIFMETAVTANGIQHSYLVFCPNRTVYRILPRGSNFCNGRVNRKTRKYAGRYMQRGNRIIIQWVRGRMILVPNGRGGLRANVRNGRNYDRVRPLNTRFLTGKWRSRSYRSVGLIVGRAPRVNRYNEGIFVFYRNGRFQSSSFTGVDASTRNRRGRRSGSGVGSRNSRNYGNFRLNGHHLELQYPGGKRINHIAFYVPGDRNGVVINGRFYIRQSK